MPESNFPFGDIFLQSYTKELNYSQFPYKDDFSTVKNVTPSFPRTYITDGDADWLMGQAREMTQALEDNKVNVTSYFPVNKGLGHDYQLDLLSEEGQKVLNDILLFMKECTLKNQ